MTGFFKKMERSAYYALIAWAVLLIVCGIPMLDKFFWLWVATVGGVMAVVVENLFGSSRAMVIEWVIDMVIGALWFVLAEYSGTWSFIGKIGSEFSIPRMSVLLGFFIVALVAQFETRPKSEEKARLKRQERRSKEMYRRKNSEDE